MCVCVCLKTIFDAWWKKWALESLNWGTRENFCANVCFFLLFFFNQPTCPFKNAFGVAQNMFGMIDILSLLAACVYFLLCGHVRPVENESCFVQARRWSFPTEKMCPQVRTASEDSGSELLWWNERNRGGHSVGLSSLLCPPIVQDFELINRSHPFSISHRAYGDRCALLWLCSLLNASAMNRSGRDIRPGKTTLCCREMIETMHAHAHKSPPSPVEIILQLNMSTFSRSLCAQKTQETPRPWEHIPLNAPLCTQTQIHAHTQHEEWGAFICCGWCCGAFGSAGPARW